MKKLLILSGKGGTGKTTTAAAFIAFSNAKRYADCDVDAPNLHILMKEDMEPEEKKFYGAEKAFIHPDQCTKCGICEKYCKFHAIRCKEGGMSIDELACEGCGVCEFICPQKAISMEKDEAGITKVYEKHHLFSTAELKMGRGNSGKLVTAVKAELLKSDIPTELIVVDGSPGIGCPVIASASGMDMVLAVIEPSLSGLSDLERLYDTVSNFGCKFAVCVNKFDVCIEKTEEIKSFCQQMDIPFVGVIPFDSEVAVALNEGWNVATVECIAKEALKKIYDRVMKIINE